MKRLVLFFLLAILSSPFVAIAQSGDKVTGAMVVTTTETIVKQPVVTPKEEPVKEKRGRKGLKTVDFKKGYQQEVSLAYSMVVADWRAISMFNINYIGGYRINQHLFVGLGTGLDFGCNYNFMPYVMEDEAGVYSGPHTNVSVDIYPILPIQKVSIPLYANFKVYFMKTRWTPFLSFSAGMRISGAKKLEVYSSKGQYSWNKYFDQYLRTEKYGAVTGMFEVMPGVSFQYNKKLAFNFQFGYATRQTYDWEKDWFTSNDVYGVQKYWAHGFTMRLGVVF